MIIGREEEKKRLENVYNSKEAELITIYGRRRVGKTYLIREFFTDKKCRIMHVTGIRKENMPRQLQKFGDAFSLTFLNNIPMEKPRTWDEAFKLLTQQLRTEKGKIVIFLDELQWLATPKSSLLEEIDSYWNTHWSAMRNVILVLCGSSASWLIQKIIFNTGGLHNRTTCKIKLSPFNLYETDLYLKSRSIDLNQNHVLSLYMALGGIPYYLKYVNSGLSAEQNIQKIFFSKEAPLKDEFDLLFDSLFDDAELYKNS